ncbi:hypothetical protein [Hymenobacter metallilatus]|uniref:TonB C-terminal domain-containing protein n=1 Tax=Hymenobacter metallilatus TaxID=2493666 RepID=A0A428JTX7_9BACT|nr:hypothetical protein [Hymenobacter metallilatus]RSK37422.1 hypothetical protein EI290_01865 [Hymenobacter metallilatus]
MPILLPILNVRLQACAEDWQQMSPTEQGRYCGSCHRTVLDFTQGTEADLAQAYATSPDGRVCGRFRADQLNPASRLRAGLRPRQRLFLAAVVLVLLQGFSARQAWAQLQAAHVCPPTSSNFLGMHESGIPTGGMTYKQGSQADFEQLVSARLQWPSTAQGRPLKSWRRTVRVLCMVDTAGQVVASQLLRAHSWSGQQPFLTELNRILAQLPQPFVAPNHYGRPIAAQTVMQFTFRKTASSH